MRSKLLVVSLLAIPLAAVGTNVMADPGDLLPAGLGDIVDKTPVGYALGAAGNQTGLAVQPAPAGGSPSGGGPIRSSSTSAFSFFPDQLMPCSLAIEGPVGCGQALEPEVKMGPDGTIYVTAQEGTPGGIMAWRSLDGDWGWKQLAKPDGIPVVTGLTGMTGGGGDNELAIGAPDPALNGGYRVYTSSLNSLVTNGVEVSTDHGDTWFSQPVASNFVGVDRQWLAASGPSTVYMSYHEQADDSILLVKSTDGGTIWSPPMEMFTPANVISAGREGGGNWESNLVAPVTGGVATAFVQNGTAGSRAAVWVAYTDAAGALHNVEIGEIQPTAAGLFPAIATDNAGNLYVTVSNLHGVFLSSSQDHGATWSPFTQINDTTGRSASTVFPFVIAGAPGNVDLAWLGSDNPGGASDSTSTWTVQFANTANALSATPTFTVSTASNHIVHTGVVCLNGTTCNPVDNSRALAEVLQMGMTRDGRALISYPDDHATSTAFTYVVEQNGGAGLLGTVTAPPLGPQGGFQSTFTPSGTLPTYFINNTWPGAAASDGIVDKPGYRLDGPTFSGRMAPFMGKVGHIGMIGYAENDAPEAGAGVIMLGDKQYYGLTIGGDLNITLWVQDDLGGAPCPAECGTIQGHTQLDFTLFDVSPSGSSQQITSHPLNALPATDFGAGSQPTRVNFDLPMQGGWRLPAGHRLELVMAFPFVTSSSMRLYYGNSTYPSGVTFRTGS